ncbi:MAG: hypothetical protein WC758_03090 [Candidatus Woesearchaeota archaeon]|jgi:hypothetical protein
MNKKAAMWSWMLGAVTLILILVLSVYLYSNVIVKGTKDAIKCPTSCSTKEEGCPIGTMASSLFDCQGNENEDLRCCVSAETIAKAGTTKKNTSNTTTNPGDGGSTSSGASIQIRDTDDETLPAWTSGRTLEAQIDNPYSFNIWLEGKNEICSINIRQITQRDSYGKIIQTNAIMPNWFTGSVTRQNCSKLNKKKVTITVPDSEKNNEFKLDILVYNNIDLNTDASSSATIYIKPKTTQPTPTGTTTSSPSINLNGQVFTSPLTRVVNPQQDIFNLVPTEDAKWCKVEVTNGIGNAVLNNNSNRYCITHEERVFNCSRQPINIYYDKTVPGLTELSCTGRIDDYGIYHPNILPDVINVKTTFYSDLAGTNLVKTESFIINVNNFKEDQEIHVDNTQIDYVCGDNIDLTIWEEKTDIKLCNIQADGDISFITEIVEGTFDGYSLCTKEHKKTISLYSDVNACQNLFNDNPDEPQEIKLYMTSNSNPSKRYDLATISVSK